MRGSLAVVAMVLAGTASANGFVGIETEVAAQDESTEVAAALPAEWNVGKLAARSGIVAVGTVQVIGLDPTSRHPRIVGLFTVEEAVAGVSRGETFPVVWTAPLPRRALIPQAGQKIVLFGESGLDGFVRPAGNGSGVYKVVPSSNGGEAYPDLRQFSVEAGAGGEKLLPLDGFVQALRDARG